MKMKMNHLNERMLLLLALAVTTQARVTTGQEYVIYPEFPGVEFANFLTKTTWTSAQATCAADGAALYTLGHSAQLDMTMANLSSPVQPWVNVQRADVGGRGECGYLDGDMPNGTALQWGECTTPHAYICQRSTSAAKTAKSIPLPVLRNLPTPLELIQQTKQLFDDMPALISTFRPPTITAAQVVQMQYLIIKTNAKLDSLETIVHPTATPPKMSADNVAKIQATIDQGRSALSAAQGLIGATKARLTLTPSLQLSLLSCSLQSQGLADTLFAVINSITTTTTTPSPALTPHEQLYQLEGYALHGHHLYTEMATLLDGLTSPTVTAGQALRVQDVLDKFLTVTNKVETLIHDETEPIGLRPYQVERIQDSVDKSRNSLSAGREIFGSSKAPFILTSSQQMILDGLASQSPDFVAVLFAVVDTATDTLARVQPTTPLEQLEQMQALGAQGQQLFDDMSALIVSISTPPVVTVAVAARMQGLIAETQTQLNAMEGVIHAVTTPPGLTPAQIQQIQAAIDADRVLLVTGQTLFASIDAPVLFSPGQVSLLNGFTAKSPALFDAFAGVIDSPTTTTTTVAPPHMTPFQQLQRLQSLGGQSQQLFDDISALMASSSLPTVTAAQATRMRAFLAQALAATNAMEAVIHAVTTPPGLTPAQVLMVQATVDRVRIVLNAALAIFGSSYAPVTLTPQEQLLLQGLSGESQELVDVIVSVGITTTTTHRPSTPHMPPDNGLTPEVTQEIQQLLSEIATTTNDVEKLLISVNRQRYELRSSAGQRRQPVLLAQRLLSLRSKPAEVKAGLGSMSFEERAALAARLKQYQARLRRLVAEPTLFAEYMTKTFGKKQIITLFLNKMLVDFRQFLLPAA